MINKKIALEANSWIGTKFVYAAQIKKTKHSSGECDCVGLIIGISNKLNIKPKGIDLNSVLPKINIQKH